MMRLFYIPVCLHKIFLLTFLVLLLRQTAGAQCIPLINGFAHNDYWHKRPLFDALDNGYTYIEADVYERDGRLIVAHLLPFLNYNRTLESLYLKPLFNHMAENNGQVYRGYNHPVTLMIDIKSDAERTYLALKPLLQKYSGILSSYANGKIHTGLITIVLSGHKPVRLLHAENARLAFVDEDLRLVKRDTLADMYMMASCKYSKLVNWRGEGAMPDPEKQRLCSFVKAAHRYGRKVRLWASPEDTHVWQTLLDCGVDLINTDKLEALKNFLNADKPLLANSKLADSIPQWPAFYVSQHNLK